MQLFIDSANLDEIKKAAESGLIDGVTTNPSLVAKEGGSFEDLLIRICEIINGPISAEVISTESKGMLEEAKKLSKIHQNIVIKLPLTWEGLRACKTLSEDGIRTNVTLCFTPLQAMMAAKAGATYISPFVGRLDDIGQVGMGLIQEIRHLYDTYGFDTKILAASIRHTEHLHSAAMNGADVSTIPYKVFQSSISHPLTDKGLAQFLKDWESKKS